VIVFLSSTTSCTHKKPAAASSCTQKCEAKFFKECSPGVERLRIILVQLVGAGIDDPVLR
jgi:hypothetical protein